MEKEKLIIIEGIKYFYFKERLMGGSLYIAEDRKAYLRINKAVEIAGELNITRELSEKRFPVPHVIGSGILANGDAYFIEESIGEKSFADTFAEETKAAGLVDDKSFDDLIKIMEKYCEAQFNPENYVPHDKEKLSHMTALANVIRNNPPSEDMKEAFFDAYNKAAERTLSLPWGYIQADLNVYNILPGGIIDFELACFGPVGYDVFTNVYFGRMWPKKDVRYRFSNEQILRYATKIDEIARKFNLPDIRDYSDDFLVLKTIWSSGKDKTSEEHPDRNLGFWHWRVQMRDWCIRCYLAGKKINTDLFEEAGNGMYQ